MYVGISHKGVVLMGDTRTISVYCQCKHCLDFFELDLVLAQDGRIVEFTPQCRVFQRNNHLEHYCGGTVQGFMLWNTSYAEEKEKKIFQKN